MSESTLCNSCLEETTPCTACADFDNDSHCSLCGDYY